MDASQLRDQVKERAAKVKETWTNLEKNRKIAAILSAIVIIAAIGFSIYFLTRKEYAVLYSGMDATEAGEIYTTLSDAGTDVKLRGTDTILVNEKEVDEIRLQLSAEGYPKSGLNYDIFEGASSFGTTDMEKQVYLKFQLEQNIRQTIRRLEKINDATVIITLASDSKFALTGQGSTPATASVVLDVAEGQSLSNSEATAIRNLIMRSVPNLESANITIVDSNMKMYSEEEETIDISNEQLALQEQVKNNLESQILNLLNPVFGQGKVSTSVNVVLDFDKRVTTSVTFEPPVEGSEDGLVVSMKELTETINGGELAEGAVGVDPNGAVTTYPTVEENEDGTYYKTTREFNAEINETKEQIESARGQISELSISVVLDGNGETISEEVLAQVSDLVAKGIGVDEENVSVAAMPFQSTADQQAAVQAQEEMLREQMYLRYGTIIGITLVILIALGVLGFIWWKKKKKDEEIQRQLEEELAGKTVEDGFDMFVAPSAEETDELVPEQTSENAEKIYKLVENNPEAVAQLLRNWLDDEYGR